MTIQEHEKAGKNRPGTHAAFVARKSTGATNQCVPPPNVVQGTGSCLNWRGLGERVRKSCLLITKSLAIY